MGAITDDWVPCGCHPETCTHFGNRIYTSFSSTPDIEPIDPTKCSNINCSNQHFLEDSDAGSEREIQRLCVTCYENLNDKHMGYMTDGLTFNVLRQANEQRLPYFKNSKGEPAHSEPDGSDWSPAQWLQAVTGELGEYANLRKKYERGDIDKETFDKEAGKELADVQIYLDILAKQLGINLGQAVISKFNEVSERIDCNIKIMSDGSDWHYNPPIDKNVPESK